MTKKLSPAEEYELNFLRKQVDHYETKVFELERHKDVARDHERAREELKSYVLKDDEDDDDDGVGKSEYSDVISSEYLNWMEDTLKSAGVDTVSARAHFDDVSSDTKAP